MALSCGEKLPDSTMSSIKRGSRRKFWLNLLFAAGDAIKIIS
jgi:hypothetical protein